MSIFTIKNNQIILDPDAFLVPEFHAIYSRDKSKDKSQALKELAYIYFYNDLKSPYKNKPPLEREESLRKDFIKDSNWKSDSLIQQASLKYQELQETPSMRYLAASINAADKLIEYFNSIDWNERTDKGLPVFKVNEVVTALSKADEIRSTLEKLRDKVEQEISTKTVRGGRELKKREM